MTDLLIQIINYNTKAYLANCLATLLSDLESFNHVFRICVLDNNSSDDLSDLRSEYGSDFVTFVNSGKNLGFGGGHNYISKLCESRVTLILNSDIFITEKNTVGRLYDRLLRSDGYSVIGPRLVLDDNSQQEFDHGELRGIMAAVKNNYGASYWKERNSETEAAWVSGAVFMCSTDVFRSVDGFDERFFLYKEEEDLCKRIREDGGRILYYPEVTVKHIGHVVARRDEHFSNSMNYYIEKHYKHKLSYKLLNAAKSARDLLFFGKVRERK